MDSTKKTSITFRTTETLKNKLEALAKKENRALSNYIEWILEKHIESTPKK